MEIERTIYYTRKLISQSPIRSYYIVKIYLDNYELYLIVN